MRTHARLTEHSLSDHGALPSGIGREGKGVEGKRTVETFDASSDCSRDLSHADASRRGDGR